VGKKKGKILGQGGKGQTKKGEKTKKMKKTNGSHKLNRKNEPPTSTRRAPFEIAPTNGERNPTRMTEQN